MVENSKRSAIKAISWRLTETIDTIIISYFITGKFTMAASIGGIEVFTKILLYFLHERAWNKITYGRRVSTEEDYSI